MKIITSRANSAVKDVCGLHTKKGRSLRQQFIAEGIRTLETILSSGLKPVALYVTQNLSISNNFDRNKITFVTPEVMAKMSCSKTPSGCLGVFAQPLQKKTELDSGLVLAGIADPGNMGTLIRSAAALNTKTVVVIEGADPWSPKVVQSSAGTIAATNILELSWQELYAHKKELPLYALVVSGGIPIAQAPQKDALLVVGSEAHGIPTEWIADCDESITIPMPGGTESLNAAVAGSIALYLMQSQSH